MDRIFRRGVGILSILAGGLFLFDITTGRYGWAKVMFFCFCINAFFWLWETYIEKH